MTKEERESIRKYIVNREWETDDAADTIAVARIHIPKLWEALEAAEKRAEALERAIKKNADACCFSCVSFEQCIAYRKTTACTLAGWNPSAWQFNQARFEGKGSCNAQRIY